MAARQEPDPNVTVQSLLGRLYRTKLIWVTIIGSAIGLGILVLGIRSARWHSHGWDWLHNVPLDAVGSTILSTCIVIIIFEYLGHQELEDRAITRLRQVLPEQERIIRKAILDGFAFNPQSIGLIASSETIDDAVRNCLAIRLDDADLATKVYDDVRQQVVKAPERWHDLGIVVTLGPAGVGREAASGRGSLFVASLRWRYRTILSKEALTFACVDNPDQYRSFLGSAHGHQVWYFERIGELSAVHPDVFKVSNATINGVPLLIQSFEEDGARRVTASGAPLSENKGNEVLVEYTYEVLVQRNSHLIVIDVAQPSRSVNVTFMYGECGVKYVNVLDFFAGPSPARIGRSTPGAPIQSIEVSFDGWVFPKSGVAFVWVLEQEMGLSVDH